MLKKNWSSEGHSAPVYDCCADETHVYSSAGDRFVTRWSLRTGEQDAFAVKLDSPAYVIGLAQHLGLLIIGCSNGTVVAIDPASKELVWEHNFRGHALFSFTDCPQNGFFVMGDGEGELLVIDYTGKLIAGFPLNCGKIREISLLNGLVWLACQDGTIRKIDLLHFNEIQLFKANEKGVNSLVVLPAAGLLISGGNDGHLKVIDTATGTVLQSLPAHYQAIYAVEILTSGELLTASMDKSIKCWNLDTMKVVQRIEFKQGGHNRSVNGCVVINPDHMVTFGDDKRVILWSRAEVH